MYIMDETDFIVLPLAYNDFCEDVISISQTGTFTGEISLERVLSASSIHKIISFISEDMKGKDRCYVIDMRNIISYAEHSFTQLQKIIEANIIFFGASDETGIKLNEDIPGKLLDLSDKMKGTKRLRKEAICQIQTKVEKIYLNETAKIVRWMSHKITKIESEKITPLDSSGVFCNMYVNAKKLFLDPDKYYFILYQMILRIAKYKEQIDALISASRNGANLANIIGWLLNIKVVHCITLGPKFSLSMQNINKDIRKRKNYFYIFDFMCLGTEAKVLNAILAVKGARLIGGMGIANYIAIDKSSGQGVISKMNTLIDTHTANLDYKIAGTKEDILKLLREGEEKDESGLQKI